MSNRENGIVKFFAIKSGYGFITAEDGDELFVSYRDLEKKSEKGFRWLEQGQKVSFNRVASNGEQRPKAVNVKTDELPSEVKNDGKSE